MRAGQWAAVSGATILLVAGLAVATLHGPGSAAVRVVEESTTPASPAPTNTTAPRTPTWRLTSYRKIGYDRSFKADLIDELPAAPRLVVFGGSRAMRFEPSYFAEHAGLSAFNCAVQNCRPEDAYAFSSYLFSRAPATRLDCVFAVQTTTFNDGALHPGLLHDERLSRAFPAALIARQIAASGKPPVKDLLDTNRFSSRGLLLRNVYDIGRERPSYSFDLHMADYLRRTLPKYTWAGRAQTSRSRAYFEKTMRLYNDHGVVPAIVIMPYHPRALRAFRAVGWQKKVDALMAYLHDAQSRCDFHVLDLLDIASFDGRARWFYDGAHVTRENARLILRYALRAAPECFR